MKLKDAESVMVKIEYTIELENKEEFENMTSDEIIRESEKDCVEGSGSHEYLIQGWNGTNWEDIDD